MSRFPGRQFTTPERHGYGRNPSSNPHTPSHHQLANLSLSRALSGSSMHRHQRSPEETRDADARDIETTRRNDQDVMTRFLRLQDERDRYLEERDQANRIADQANARCQALETDLQHLENQVAIVKQRERKLQADLDTVRQDLRRARQTIQQQSRAFDGPRAATPSTSLQVMSRAESRFGEDYGFGVRPVAVKQPDPRESLYAPAESFASDPYSQVNRRQQDPLPRVEWATEFTGLFKMVETFCWDNINVPNQEGDKEWPTALANEVARESDPDHVRSLINDRRTRYLLITRIIVAWIMSHYFHIKIIKGFSRSYDKAVLDIHTRLKKESSPSVRRGLTQAEADTIAELSQLRNFDGWSTNQIRAGVNSMMSRLSPAITRNTNLVRVGQDFEAVLREAWRIGMMMATRTDSFQMWIPPSSALTLFNPRCMLNRNPYEQPGTPDELVKRRATVSLGVTPHITVTDIMVEKPETMTVHLADVVLHRHA
ncbi:MAG: hypothetical protein LQ348_003001 [Seirophora lacunosa]|nr:MAG: hypothetical protein LQ348_003001 [Seirophora lacunosa]